MAGEAAVSYARNEASASEDTPPDWGDDDNLDSSPADKPYEEHASTRPAESQWPCGPEGRPSDRGCSSGHTAGKPNEPIGEPPKRGSGEATDGGGKAEREPCPQPQLASSVSASTHAETEEEHDKESRVLMTRERSQVLRGLLCSGDHLACHSL